MSIYNFLLKKPQLLLLLICLLGFIFRLLGLINITLAGDFAAYWRIAGGIAALKEFPLLGPVASVNLNFHLGPFYYYLLAIPYFLGKGDFHIAIIFVSLLNTISIFFLYNVCKHWFTAVQSLKMTTLYALSSYMISIQSFPWNSYILPLFIILALYCLTRIQTKKYYFVPLLFMCLCICLQAHATAVFLLPVFVLLLPLKKIPARFYITGIFLFLALSAPWIYADLTTNFSQTRAGFAILTPGTSERCSFSYYLSHHGNGEHCFSQIRNSLFIFRLFSKSLFFTDNIIIVLLTFITTIIFLLKEKFSHKKFFFFWLGIPWLLFLFYSSNIYLHYFLILIPIPFMMVVLLLDKLKTYGKLGNMLNNSFFILLILINIIQYLLSLHALRG